MADFDAMTVNERLFAANLRSDYDEAVASNDLLAINRVLEKVGLRQDESGMNWSIEADPKSERKTLKLGATTEAPAIKKKGRGWEISDKRLDVLHDQAREMRRHSTPAHKALAARFAKADLGRHKFTRHAVIGSAIVDFGCPTLGMAIALDEEGVDPAIATRRDKSLNSVGIRVMRIKAADVLGNIDAVLARITAGMRMRIGDKRAAAHAHKEANPRQSYSRPKSQGRPQDQPQGRPERPKNAYDR